MPKLTLSADKDVIEKAKQMAGSRGTSISAMFSQFVRATSMKKESSPRKLGPITRRVAGIARISANKPYRQLIEEAILEKHGR